MKPPHPQRKPGSVLSPYEMQNSIVDTRVLMHGVDANSRGSWQCRMTQPCVIEEVFKFQDVRLYRYTESQGRTNKRSENRRKKSDIMDFQIQRVSDKEMTGYE